MAKKKKKANTQAQQKVHAAQHRKHFMERLHQLCTIIGNGEPLFDFLPQYVLTAIYDNRGVAPKIKVDKDTKITKRLVKILYCQLENDMKNTYLDLMVPEVRQRVTLIDYYQVLISLEAVLSSPTCLFSKKEKFNVFLEKMDDRYDKYADKFTYLIEYACFMYSDFSKHCVYTYNHDSYRSSGLLYQIITIGTYPLEVRYATIHGDRRPIIQTGELHYNEGKPYLMPNTVSYRQLHIKDPSGKKEVPVYIQQHAVDRTLQRTCCGVPGGAISFVNGSFIQKLKIINEGDKYLVECRWGEIKIGYFVGMLINNIFVILTFLLITHSSTPEGRKLSQITGLKREDMEFLAIDDLKTLINSDIARDKRIIKIFTAAGCKSILKMNNDLHNKGEFEWLRDNSKRDTELSKLIAEYIQLGASDEEYYENE
jgi:hypothetical protein